MGSWAGAIDATNLISGTKALTPASCAICASPDAIHAASASARHFLPPSPPAEKAAARQDQAWKSGTGDGTGNLAHVATRDSVVETEPYRATHRFTKSN